MKLTQKEKVAGYLVAKMPKWVKSYELVKAPSEAGFLGLQSDRRAYE